MRPQHRPPPHSRPIVATAPVSDDAIDAFHTLERRNVNFQPIAWDQACADPDWRTDHAVRTIATENPGPPEPGGPYQRAARALESYQFADPDIIRGIYDPDTALEGRNMLLVGRFLHLRFHMGVRIGGVIDATTTHHGQPIHRFGWHYRTLQGHLEQGQMNYELRKYLDAGDIEFGVHGYSRAARIDNPSSASVSPSSADTSSFASTAGSSTT